MTPPGRISIRPATIADHGRINALAEQMDRLHRDALPGRFRRPDGPNRARPYVESLIADPDTFLAVAELDGVVAALINSGLDRTPDIPVKPPCRFLRIRGLIVDEAHRRKGLGRALATAAMEWAAARGATEVQLSVYDFNETAAAFYHGLGFAPLSHRLVRPIAP